MRWRCLVQLARQRSERFAKPWRLLRFANARGNQFLREMRVRWGRDRQARPERHFGRAVSCLTLWALDYAKSGGLIRLCRTRGAVRTRQEEWGEEPWQA